MMPDESINSTAVPSSTTLRRIVILVSLAISAGIGVTWFLEGNGLQSCPGLIEARTTNVTTNRLAVVGDVLIKTGQNVVPGDPLYQLIDTDLKDRLAGKALEITEHEAEIVRAKAVADVELAWRRRELQADIFETQLKVASLAQDKLNKQVEQIAWKEHLMSSDGQQGQLVAEVGQPFRSISLELQKPDERRLQAMLREDAAAATVEALATQITLCEQRLKKLEALDQELEVKLRASSGIDLADARCNAVKQELAVLESQAKELTVSSPTYGTIGEIRLRPGDRVSTGTSLVEILDDQQLRIVAQIPSSSASKIRQGTKVTVLFPENQRRIGIVAAIPPQAVSLAGASESVLAIKIDPAGKLWPKLAIGSDVKVLLP